MISYIPISFHKSVHYSGLTQLPVIWGHHSMNEKASNDFHTARVQMQRKTDSVPTGHSGLVVKLHCHAFLLNLNLYYPPPHHHQHHTESHLN